MCWNVRIHWTDASVLVFYTPPPRKSEEVITEVTICLIVLFVGHFQKVGRDSLLPQLLADGSETWYT